MNFAAALVLATAGLGLLYGSWTDRLRPRLLVIIMGWVLASGSLAFWVGELGVEYGLALGVTTVAVVAWGYSAIALDRQPAADRRPQPRAAGTRPRRRDVIEWVARVLVVVALSGLASILFCTVATVYLPTSAANRYALVLLGVPLVWGALAVWIGTTSRLPHVAATLASASAAWALMLFL